MLLSKAPITKAWRCIFYLRHFLGGISFTADPRLREDSDCHGYYDGFRSGGGHDRGYRAGTPGSGEFRSNHESNDVRYGNGESGNSWGSAAPKQENIASTGKHRRSQSQNRGVGGRKPTANRRNNSSRRGSFENGFRMPDFDPGNEQLKKIFESQMDSCDSIGALDLGEVGPIEGNFRDDDDSEAEDFYKSA